MDKLTAINVFLTLAECESFTATAEKLDISRPMVSRYIALMEEWLNARLFQRTTRHVKLTDAGEQAVIFCRQIADLAEQAQNEALDNGELRGTLRIATTQSFGVSYLMPQLSEFMRLHPKLQVHLNAADGSLNLVEQRIDLAIRITNNPDPNLIARKLAVCHSQLVATPDYLAQHGTPETPAELKQHRCLAHSNLNKTLWAFNQDGKREAIELTSPFTTNDTACLLNACKNGLGIAMLPRYLLQDDLAQGRLVAVLPEWHLPEFTVYALYPSRDRLPQRVRRFLDFLVERLALAGL